MPEIKIRKAVREDYPFATEMIYASMGRFGDSALGFDDHAFTLKILEGFYIRTKNRFSYEISWVAEIDGKPAGVLVAFPGSEYWRKQMVMGRQAFQVYGYFKAMHLIIRSFALAAGTETERDELYISHLATDPKYRRKGIGTALLHHAETLMRQAGLSKCSLIVELDNLIAQKVYLENGFKIIEKVETPQFEKKFHTPGYYRMVKSFS